MKSGSHLRIQQYCSQMDQSIAFHDSDGGEQSPITGNSTISLLLPHSSHRDNYYDMNQTTSIEEELIGNHSTHPQKKYKCFKCYGKNSRNSLKYKVPICPQCDGTEYISDKHALAHILDQLLIMKIPQLASKNKDNLARSIREPSFGKNSIKQQNLYNQGQAFPQCRTCGYDCDDISYRICTVCDNFAICSYCFVRGKINHRPDHALMKVLNTQNDFPSLSGLSHHPPNMKKISQEGQSEEMSNYLQQAESKCQNCNQPFEQISSHCLTCQKAGTPYIICSNCSDNKSYIHDPNHQMEMKTICQGSKLNRLLSKPSQAQSITIPEQDHYVRSNTQNSLIRINSADLQDSYEYNPLRSTAGGKINLLQSICRQFKPKDLQKGIPQEEEDPIFGQTFTSKPIENFKFTTETQKDPAPTNNYRNPQQSVIRIDMENSADCQSNFIRHSAQTNLFTPFSVPFKSQIKTKHTKNTNPEQYVFNNYQCDICGTNPIKNKRYHCKECEDYDLCEICYLTKAKKHVHDSFEEIDGRLLLKRQKDLVETALLRTTARDFSKKTPTAFASSLK